MPLRGGGGVAPEGDGVVDLFPVVEPDRGGAAAQTRLWDSVTATTPAPVRVRRCACCLSSRKGGSLDRVQAEGGQDAAQAWEHLDPAARRSMEMAHTSLVAGGLAVGSALADADGRVVAAGRNRAYDLGAWEGALQGTPLAHAEMNVLAAVATGRDMRAETLWSTQQPCSMCDAALVFTGVGTVRWLGADPWVRASGASEARPDDGLRRVSPADDRWMVVVSVLFLASVALTRGVRHPTVECQRELEPETHSLLQELLAAEGASLRAEQAVTVLLARMWHGVRNAAAARHDRRSRPLS